MIRVGMIGCGGMAGVFLRGLGELGTRLRVTAIVDVDPDKLTTAAPSAPEAVRETDYRRILDAVDAVILALPHDLHHSIATDCLRAGKHVLLEKPMANSERECLDLIATAGQCRRVLCIGYVMRHDPLWNTLGEWIRTRRFGEVFQLSIWTEQLTKYFDGHWSRTARRLGGGQLFSHGCHYIDLLLHWMGRPVRGTHVGTNLGTPWMEWEGTSNVCIEFENRALGYHFGTWGARGSKLRYSVHAHCTEGMLELNHAEGTITLHRDPSGGDLPALQSAIDAGAEIVDPKRTVLCRAPRTGKSTNPEVIEFLDCIETGKEPMVGPRAALQSLRVIWRLYDAEQRGVVADLRGLGLDQFKDEPIVGEAGQPG